MGYFSKCRFFGPTLIQLIRISKTELRNLHFNKLSGWFISTWKLGKHWPNQNEVMDHPLYWRWVLVPWCSIEWEGSVNVTSSFTVKDVVQFLDLILQFHQFKIFPLITITYYYLPENFLHLGLFPNSVLHLMPVTHHLYMSILFCHSSKRLQQKTIAEIAAINYWN